MLALNVLDLVKGLGGAVLPLTGVRASYILKRTIMVKRTRRRSHLSRKRWWQRGFSLIETLVIVAVIGIVGAIALPSFASMMEGMKVNQAATELRTAFQETQRQAIRKNQACTVQVFTGSTSNQSLSNLHPRTHPTPSISGDCLSSGSPSLPSKIQLATNIKSVDPPNPNVSINYGTQGSAEFSILSAAQAYQLPADPTGKIVTFVDNPKSTKKCVAISRILGLTRMGTYTGSLNAAAITDTGICTAKDWTKQ